DPASSTDDIINFAKAAEASAIIISPKLHEEHPDLRKRLKEEFGSVEDQTTPSAAKKQRDGHPSLTKEGSSAEEFGPAEDQTTPSAAKKQRDGHPSLTKEGSSADAIPEVWTF